MSVERKWFHHRLGFFSFPIYLYLYMITPVLSVYVYFIFYLFSHSINVFQKYHSFFSTEIWNIFQIGAIIKHRPLTKYIRKIKARVHIFSIFSFYRVEFYKVYPNSKSIQLQLIFCFHAIIEYICICLSFWVLLPTKKFFTLCLKIVV